MSQIIECWDENFVTVTFVEIKDGTYEFFCFEKPIASKNMFSFNLFRHGGDQINLKKFKHEFNSSTKLQLCCHENTEDILHQVPHAIGPLISIKNINVITEDDFIYKEHFQRIPLDYKYYWENTAHLLLNQNNDSEL